jgi:hypothetical protein
MLGMFVVNTFFTISNVKRVTAYQRHVSTKFNFIRVFITGRNLCIELSRMNEFFPEFVSLLVMAIFI